MENKGLKKWSRIQDIFPESDISFEKICNYLKPLAAYGLRDMLNALIECSETGDTIAIYGKHEDVMYYAFAIYKAFPAVIANNILFSLSNYEEKSLCKLKVLGSEWEEEVENPPAHTFSLEENIKIRSAHDYRFTHLVEMGYLISINNLIAFNSFLGHFKYNNLDSKIEDAYNIYSISKTGIGELSLEEVKSALEFTYSYGNDGAYRQILINLGHAIEKMSGEVTLQSGEALACFMFRAAEKTKSLFFINRANEFFFKCLYNLILKSHEGRALEVYELYENVLGLNKDSAEKFMRYIIDPKRIGIFIDYLQENNSPEKAEIVLRMILGSFINLKFTWKKALLVEGFNRLLEICILNIATSNIDLLPLLKILSQDENYFVNVFLMIYRTLSLKSAKDEMVKNLAEVLKAKDDNSALRIRRWINSEEDGSSILFEEFSVLVSEFENLLEFFEAYYNKVFHNIQGFADKFGSEAVKLYIRRLSDEDRLKGAFRVLQYVIENKLSLDDEALRMVINSFEKGLKLSPPEDNIRKIIPAVKNIKRSRGIKTVPDIVNLLDLAIWLEEIDKSSEDIVEEVINEGIDIGYLDDERYRQYVNWCMPSLIGFCRSPEDHRMVIRIFNITESQSEFFIEYMRCVEKILQEDNKRGYRVFLSFMTYFFFYFQPKYKLQGEEELLNNVIENISIILSKQSKSWLKHFNEDIKEEFQSRGLSLPVQWSEIYSNILKSKGIFFLNRITEFFKR
jgi:hypothetical protein